MRDGSANSTDEADDADDAELEIAAGVDCEDKDENDDAEAARAANQDEDQEAAAGVEPFKVPVTDEAEVEEDDCESDESG